MRRRDFLRASAAWLLPEIVPVAGAAWAAPVLSESPGAAVIGAPHLQFDYTAIVHLRDRSWPLSGVATSPALLRLADVRSRCNACDAEPERQMLGAVRACIERAARGAAGGEIRAVSVTAHRDGSLEVADDGPPLPIGLDPRDRCEYYIRPLLEVWLTEAPERPGGTVPDDLSRLTAVLVAGRCEVRVHSDGLLCAMAFEQGIRRERTYGDVVDGRPAWPMSVLRKTTWRGNAFRFWPHSERLPFEATDERLREIDELLAHWRTRFPAISFALVDRRGRSSKRPLEKSSSDPYAHRALRCVVLEESQTQPVRDWARPAEAASESGARRTSISPRADEPGSAQAVLRIRAGLDALPPVGATVLDPAGDTAIYRRNAVRKRPGMYLGDTADPRTLVRLISTLCLNVALGPGSAERTVDVALHPRGAFTIAVDGPALPVALAADDPCELRVRPVLEILLTEDHMAAYVLANGALRWHNFDAGSAWTFMVHVCSRFAVRVHRGSIYQLVLDRGLRMEDPFGPPGPDGRTPRPMRELGPTAWHGNEFVVQPDEDIFAPEALRIEPADVESALRSWWIVSGPSRITVHDWRDGGPAFDPARAGKPGFGDDVRRDVRVLARTSHRDSEATALTCKPTLTFGYGNYVAPPVA